MVAERALRAAAVAAGAAVAVAGVFAAGLRQPTRPAFAAVKSSSVDVLAVGCLAATGCTRASGHRIVLVDTTGRDPRTTCPDAVPGSTSSPVHEQPGLAACVVGG